MMKKVWDDEDYNEAILFDDLDKGAGFITRCYWDDLFNVMNSVFGEAAVLEAIEWIKKTGDKAMLYHYNVFFSGELLGPADKMEGIIRRFYGPQFSGEDVETLCTKWSAAILELGMRGVHNPQLAFLTSDLACFADPVKIIRSAVEKLGTAAVVDIIDTLIEYNARAMADLWELLQNDEPFEAICHHDGAGYPFKTWPSHKDE